MRKTHQSTHSTICWLCGIPNRSYSIVPDTKVVRYPTKLNLESSWIDTKTHSFSTINPAFIQDKSKEGMQISLRYDYPLRKPIFWRAEISRIRPIPTVIGSVNAYRTYRERLNTQNMISFMDHHEVDLGSNLSMAEMSLEKSVPRFLFGGNAPINWVRK